MSSFIEWGISVFLVWLVFTRVLEPRFPFLKKGFMFGGEKKNLSGFLIVLLSIILAMFFIIAE